MPLEMLGHLLPSLLRLTSEIDKTANKKWEKLDCKIYLAQKHLQKYVFCDHSQTVFETRLTSPINVV